MELMHHMFNQEDDEVIQNMDFKPKSICYVWLKLKKFSIGGGLAELMRVKTSFIYNYYWVTPD
jgi:hypothetical protein